MTTQELQDYIHVYSMFTFKDGRKMPGICINKYNLKAGEIEYYFVSQENMHAYKTAFDKYDKDTCMSLCTKLEAKDLLNIRPVSLSDYKVIMQLLSERNQLMSYQR
jgi:hypothetical protein